MLAPETQHLNSNNKRGQSPRMSTQQARNWLGLPGTTSEAETPGNNSVSSSADSADVAGGRGASLYNFDGRNPAVATNMVQDLSERRIRVEQQKD